MGKSAIIVCPMLQIQTWKNYRLRCMVGHYFRDWIMTCKEVRPASRKTHYSLLKTEDEVVSSKSPWASIMQPGSDPRHPQSSLRGHTVFSVKYNMQLQPLLLWFFLTELVFAASSHTSAVSAAKSSGTFKNLHSKILARYSAAIHCLARAEKSRKSQFPCLLNALLGHGAYNLYESIKRAWDRSPAPRPTGME